ncbi:hypothetical protein ACOME3_004359 [Neoechinorhynchus agilis]
MAERRKLQLEIDRVLKKISEGVDNFEDTWKKAQSTSNQSQKDKFEQEMKKEIKKLQRLRDQVKNWLASNEVKDKEPLLDSRRLIENLMERFKVVEKESKTKAYSKEGLGACQKLDPQEKEKEDAILWITEAIKRMKQNTELLEGQSESMNVRGGKKKKKEDKQTTNRLNELKELIGRNTQHMEGLERALRLVDNDAIDMKRVNELHDDVDLYLNDGPDHDYEDDDLLYQEVSFEEDPLRPIDSVQTTTNISTVDIRANRRSESDDYQSTNASIQSKQGANTKHRILSHPPLALSTTTIPPPPPLPPTTTTTKQLRTSVALKPQLPSRQVSATLEGSSSSMSFSGCQRHFTGVPGMSTSLQSLSQTTDKSSSYAWKGMEHTRRSVDSVVKEAEDNPWTSPVTVKRDRSESSTSLRVRTPSQMKIDTEIPEVPVQEIEQVSSNQTDESQESECEPKAIQVIQEKSEDDNGESRGFNRKLLLQGAIESFKQLPSMYNHDFNRSPIGRLPILYPNKVLNFPDPQIEKYEQFVELSTATLFFIFYHQEGTLAQYFAAKVLKSRSWRFHTELRMWFQRHDDPSLLCEEYEEGDYIYFDHNSWVQKRWNNFKFEYRALEDKDL